MLHDLRFGFRTLLRARGWTIVILLSLALGIGANTALFSAANGLVLKKLPVEDPDSLVRLQWTGRNVLMTSHSEFGYLGNDASAAFSYGMFRQFAE